MAYTSHAHQKSSKRNIERPCARRASSVTKRARLFAELKRQRDLLMDRARISQDANVEAELHPDPVDQASIEFDRGLAMKVKIRTFDKLCRIEPALHLIHTSKYGRCRRCDADIPYGRLKVQPDALYCVPCLTLVEQNEQEDHRPQHTHTLIFTHR